MPLLSTSKKDCRIKPPPGFERDTAAAGGDQETMAANRKRPLYSCESSPSKRVRRPLGEHISITETTNTGQLLPEHVGGQTSFTFDQTFCTKVTKASARQVCDKAMLDDGNADVNQFMAEVDAALAMTATLEAADKENANSKVKKLRTVWAGIQSKLEDMVAEKEKAQMKVPALESEVAELKWTNQVLKSEACRFEAKEKAVSLKHGEVSRENERLSASNERLKAEKVAALKDLNKSLCDNGRLKTKLANLNGCLNKVGLERNRLSVSLDTLQSQSHSVQEQWRGTMNQLATATENVKTLKTENETLLQRLQAEKTKSRTLISRLTATGQELNDAVSSANSKVEKLEQRLASEEAQVVSLSTDLAKSQEEVASLLKKKAAVETTSLGAKKETPLDICSVNRFQCKLDAQDFIVTQPQSQHRKCTDCGVLKTFGEFSRQQLIKRGGGTKKCAVCAKKAHVELQAEAQRSSEKECCSCGRKLGAASFSSTHWKRTGASGKKCLECQMAGKLLAETFYMFK